MTLLQDLINSGHLEETEKGYIVHKPFRFLDVKDLLDKPLIYKHETHMDEIKSWPARCWETR